MSSNPSMPNQSPMGGNYHSSTGMPMLRTPGLMIAPGIGVGGQGISATGGQQPGIGIQPSGLQGLQSMQGLQQGQRGMVPGCQIMNGNPANVPTTIYAPKTLMSCEVPSTASNLQPNVVRTKLQASQQGQQSNQHSRQPSGQEQQAGSQVNAEEQRQLQGNPATTSGQEGMTIPVSQQSLENAAENTQGESKTTSESKTATATPLNYSPLAQSTSQQPQISQQPQFTAEQLNNMDPQQAQVLYEQMQAAQKEASTPQRQQNPTGVQQQQPGMPQQQPTVAQQRPGMIPMQQQQPFNIQLPYSGKVLEIGAHAAPPAGPLATDCSAPSSEGVISMPVPPKKAPPPSQVAQTAASQKPNATSSQTAPSQMLNAMSTQMSMPSSQKPIGSQIGNPMASQMSAMSGQSPTLQIKTNNPVASSNQIVPARPGNFNLAAPALPDNKFVFEPGKMHIGGVPSGLPPSYTSGTAPMSSDMYHPAMSSYATATASGAPPMHKGAPGRESMSGLAMATSSSSGMPSDIYGMPSPNTYIPYGTTLTSEVRPQRDHLIEVVLSDIELRGASSKPGLFPKKGYFGKLSYGIIAKTVQSWQSLNNFRWPQAPDAKHPLKWHSKSNSLEKDPETDASAAFPGEGKERAENFLSLNPSQFEEMLMFEIWLQTDHLTSSEQTPLGRAAVDLRNMRCRRYAGQHEGHTIYGQEGSMLGTLFLQDLRYTTIPDDPPEVQSPGQTQTRIDLEWLKPSFDGGTDISNYMLFMKNEKTDKWDVISKDVKTTKYSVTSGLIGNTSYIFQIRAKNRVGESPGKIFSCRTAPTVPLPIPGKPEIKLDEKDRPADCIPTHVANPKNLAARTGFTVCFSKPASDGGSSILFYRIWICKLKNSSWWHASEQLGMKSKEAEWVDMGPLSAYDADSRCEQFRFRIENIEKHCRYSAKVFAVNAVGYSTPGEETAYVYV